METRTFPSPQAREGGEQGQGSKGRNVRIVFRHMRLGIGWVLVACGAVLLPLPLPFGLPLIIIGLAILLRESHFLQRLVRYWRRRSRRFDNQFVRVRPHVPGFAKKIIDVTEPRPLRRMVSGDILPPGE